MKKKHIFHKCIVWNNFIARIISISQKYFKKFSKWWQIKHPVKKIRYSTKVLGAAIILTVRSKKEHEKTYHYWFPWKMCIWKQCFLLPTPSVKSSLLIKVGREMNCQGNVHVVQLSTARFAWISSKFCRLTNVVCRYRWNIIQHLIVLIFAV